MRRFNPDKELKKIQKGNKNKIIFGVIVLLLIIAIGSSYALYQVRYSKSIIYTKVGNFYQNDVVLSVYIDGEKKTEPNSFPDKDSGKIFSHVTCKNGGTGYFDNTKWELNLKTTEQDRCDVYFVTGNLPNEPELFQGMIPVTFSDTGIMYVADTNSDWYNYQDHRWANAVLVNASNATIKNKYFDGTTLRNDIAGKEVPMEDVLQMYVWIPRYKYKIFNEGTNGVKKQIIEIEFEKGDDTTGTVSCTYTDAGDGKVTEDCKNFEKGNWYTHPAFTFGETNLKGFWIGKFEPSDAEDEIGRNVNSIGEVTILPDKTSMVVKSVSTAFYAERDLIGEKNKYNLNSTEIDTRVMKNIEWGAMAYLTQSIYGIYTNGGEGCVIEGMDKDNCEVWINNTAQGTGTEGTYSYGGTHTGCAGDSVSAVVKWNTEAGTVAKCDDDKVWTKDGVKASTTGNMYGIYDTSGGASEYVMGAIVNETTGGLFISSGSGFTNEEGPTKLPDSKYYDIYTFSRNEVSHHLGHFADATKETMTGWWVGLSSGWNGDSSQIPSASYWNGVWFYRGKTNRSESGAGIFAYGRSNGESQGDVSFRSVLSAA